jgi:hypothetical protein
LSFYHARLCLLRHGANATERDTWDTCRHQIVLLPTGDRALRSLCATIRAVTGAYTCLRVVGSNAGTVRLTPLQGG